MEEDSDAEDDPEMIQLTELIRDMDLNEGGGAQNGQDEKLDRMIEEMDIMKKLNI